MKWVVHNCVQRSIRLTLRERKRERHGMPTSPGFPDEETLRWLAPRIERFFRRRLPSHVDPSDLVAEVLASFATYRGEASPKHYAFRVARHRLAQLQRQPARIERLSTRRVPCDPQPSASTQLRQREAEQAVRSEVAEIPECFADVVRLHLDGHTPQEIAERLAINNNTVRSRLGRGLRHLRSRLEQRFGITTPASATSRHEQAPDHRGQA